jgi:hypothetical protein
MADPQFLDFKEADHRAGRALPYVAALIEWIEREQTQGTIAVLQAVRDDKHQEARYLLAKVDAFGDIVNRCFEKDPPPEPDNSDDEFIDPATPPSARGGQKNARKE